jgi:hypothetical protein
MNVFQNILYLHSWGPTRCSVPDTDRPQAHLVERDAPAGIETQLSRTGKMGILRRGGSLNSSTYAVPEQLPVSDISHQSTEGLYRR